MSLYNLTFGVNPLSKLLLNYLSLEEKNFGRYRDMSLFKEGETYIIRGTSRTGGGNREAYKEINDKLTTHPLYIKDSDDTFDSTYAYFYFKLPTNLLNELKDHNIAIEDLDLFADNYSMKEKLDMVIGKT